MSLHRGNGRAGTGKVVSLAICFTLTAAPGQGQGRFPPDSFTNLQALPEDIGQRELVGMMRSFATGLGVRCQFCHVGEEGMPLSEFDFPADEKITKRKAREMIRMVRTINDELLANVPERSDPPIEVTCETCHHAQSRPRTTIDLLTEAYGDGGVDAAIGKYHELRDEYYGSYSYDFTEGVLWAFAEQLARPHPDDAVQVAELNLEFFPESGNTYFLLGEVHLIRADTAAAVESFEKSLEIAPSPFIQRRLDGLKGN